MKQYSGVFIAETVKLYLRHGSLRKTAFKQCVSKSSLQRWVKRLGSMIRQPRRATRRSTRKSKVPAEQIKSSLERNPFITLREIAEVCNCSVATACRAVRRAGFSFKKASHRPQARDQQERLHCFISTCASIDLDDTKLYIDTYTRIANIVTITRNTPT
jgi:transposase